MTDCCPSSHPKPSNPETELENAVLRDRMQRGFATTLAGVVAPPTPTATESNTQHTEKAHMRIAIPLDNGCVSAHFGHCSAFELYDVDEATKTTRSKTTLPAPSHEPGVLPRWLHEQGANVIIAGGMGQRAQELFAGQGIQVVVGAPSNPTDEIVAAYLTGTLQAGANICDH